MSIYSKLINGSCLVFTGILAYAYITYKREQIECLSSKIKRTQRAINNPNRPVYICFSSIEGTGKTTLVKLLATELKRRGFKVHSTKEPGCPDQPNTLIARDLMLNNKWNDDTCDTGRELMSQYIRANHMQKKIYPMLDGNYKDGIAYDFILQDRGVADSYAYALGCMIPSKDIDVLLEMSVNPESRGVESPIQIYDKVVYLEGDVVICLERARACKAEFAAGDIIEGKGPEFMTHVRDEMESIIKTLEKENKVMRIQDVHAKNIDTVFAELLAKMEAEYPHIKLQLSSPIP
jgi:thymidylate kinase